MKAIVNMTPLVTLEIEGTDDMETLYLAGVFSGYRKKCNVCESIKQKKLRSNKDKEGNYYIKMMCTECGAESKLGRLKVGGYFWNEYMKYEPKEQTPSQDTNQEEPPIPDNIDF